MSRIETESQTYVELTTIEGQNVPRGTVHVSPAALTALGAAPGDTVRIQGVRATVALVEAWPAEEAAARPTQPGARATPGDQFIQMNGLVRQNAGAALGD